MVHAFYLLINVPYLTFYTVLGSESGDSEEECSQDFLQLVLSKQVKPKDSDVESLPDGG